MKTITMKTKMTTDAQGRTCASWQCLTITAIKLLAVALMFLDHVHQMFAAAGAPMWLTMAGRLVFPMFLFAAAESFHYTRSKKKYLQRLLLASWGMTLFTFLLQRILPNKNVILMNNAFSTFFMAGLYMLFWDWFSEGIRKREPKQIVRALLACLLPVLGVIPLLLVGMLSATGNASATTIRVLATISMLVPNILAVEGGFALVILGVLFYIFRTNRVLQMLILLLLSLVTYLTGGGIQCLMGLAVIPMALYNGKKGHGLKKFFYIFYPAHIGILYVISSLIV